MTKWDPELLLLIRQRDKYTNAIEKLQKLRKQMERVIQLKTGARS